MIERKLNAVLERDGVTQLDALGQPFDPAMHEAVASDPGSSGDKSWRFSAPDTSWVIRFYAPAMVRTGDKPVA